MNSTFATRHGMGPPMVPQPAVIAVSRPPIRRPGDVRQEDAPRSGKIGLFAQACLCAKPLGVTR